MAKKTNLYNRKSKRRATPAKKPVVLANNASMRSVRPARPSRNPSSRTPKPQHISAVCSVLDPFCPASKNSKWPDGSTGKTMTEQFRGNATFSATATNFNRVVVFQPSAPFGYIDTASSTATTCVLSGSGTTYKANSLFVTHGALYRIVSFGIIFRCVASATGASGTLTLGTTASPPLNGGTVTLGTELYEEVVIKAIQPGMEVSWISQPRNDNGARTLVAAQTTSVAPIGGYGWNACVLEIAGVGAAIPVISAEWFMNIEFTLGTNTALTAAATPNPPKSAAAQAAVSTVHRSIGSFVEGGVKQVEDAVAKHASTALSSLFSDPLESLSALFGML